MPAPTSARVTPLSRPTSPATQLLFHLEKPERVAGVVIEPVLGSGGCIAPPDTFWPALTELCREHGWLLCVDEVKSGYGRSGTMLAVER